MLVCSVEQPLHVMNTLFDDETSTDRHPAQAGAPLAERMRPRVLDDLAGQDHLVGKGAPLRAYVERNELPSIILWGPPGTGKTTLANILAASLARPLDRLSAVEAGVKELRDVIRRAERLGLAGKRPILFIDEIHRFNKSQQDALLHAVERGIVTLIGATTENPSFEVNNALLSRCRVYTLAELSRDALRSIVERALRDDVQLSKRSISVADWDALLMLSGGDARSALNILEAAVLLAPEGVQQVVINRDLLATAVQRRVVAYDRAGDHHYDTISAFIKSLRGSDPDAALLYLALMIEAGEDPTFIARRLIVFASEDIGNADPLALQTAVSVFQALERIGMPEGRIPLAQAVTYLASAPKSNASYLAIERARGLVQQGISVSIPLHLRNAPTSLMKELGHGNAYRYPHDSPEHFVHENYFPDGVVPVAWYLPDGQGAEETIRERLRVLWPERYQTPNE